MIPSRSRLHDERGSMSLELAILTPVLVLIALFVVALGRLVLADQTVGSIASDAARAASIAANPSAATAAAQQAANADLAAHGITCAPLTVTVDTVGFNAGGSVSVAVACTTSLGGLSLLHLPGGETLHGSANAPVDAYRQVTS